MKAFEKWWAAVGDAEKDIAKTLTEAFKSVAEESYLAATERAAGIAEDEFQHLINGEGLVVPRVAVKAHLETFKERICASKSKE